MFGRLRDFASRHRRKFVVTGLVVGGTFVAIKYAQKKLIEYQERMAREFFEQSRRMQHFESTERTCNQVIIGMSTELCQAIIAECSTDELLEKLRQNPVNKLQLWEEMKIVSFTRLTAFIYASSMLVVALRVQLNVLGGYLYRDLSTDQKQMSDNLKQQYLSLIRNFIYEGGLRELVAVLRTQVTAVMRNIPLSKMLTLADLEQLFWSIQMAINGSSSDPNAKMATYLLPPQVPEYNDCGPLLEKMFNDTLDVLESDEASSICSSNICRGFSIALDAIVESIHESLLVTKADQSGPGCSKSPNVQSEASGTEMSKSSAVLNLNQFEIALAKVIPIVNGFTARTFDSSKHPQNFATALTTFYVVAEKCKVLGGNVYETFSAAS